MNYEIESIEVEGGAVVFWSRRFDHVIAIQRRDVKVFFINGGWGVSSAGSPEMWGTLPREAVVGWKTRAPTVDFPRWIASAEAVHARQGWASSSESTSSSSSSASVPAHSVIYGALACVALWCGAMWF
jgi:hypothetical protein